MAGSDQSLRPDGTDARQWPWAVFLLLLCAAFVAVALTRRVNFDEWLVLHAGWLLANGMPSDLHFLMPFTWLMGIVADSIPDVAWAVLLPRTAVAVLVLWLLWWSLRQNVPATAARWALIACLTSGAFISHAIEFRYDAVILCAWLGAWGLLGRPTNLRYALVGVLACVLALHHTKGMFYALSLAAFILFVARPRRRDYLLLAGGAALTLGGWLTFLLATGLLEEQAAIYLQFAERATAGSYIGAWWALRARILEDWVWWLIVLPPFMAGLWAHGRSRAQFGTLWFGLTPVIFIYLHPRPWDYMVASVIPFLAVFAALGFEHLRERLESLQAGAAANEPAQTGLRRRSLREALRELAGGSIDVRKLAQSAAARLRAPHLVLAWLLMFSVAGIAGYTRSLGAPNSDQIELLRLLRGIAVDRDTVLDPTGAAFFIRPVAPDWYLDGLFRPRVASGRWMSKTLASGGNATIVINSYRLRWLPKPFVEGLSSSHVKACGWIWLRRDDARITALSARCPVGDDSDSLSNFWGR